MISSLACCERAEAQQPRELLPPSDKAPPLVQGVTGSTALSRRTVRPQESDQVRRIPAVDEGSEEGFSWVQHLEEPLGQPGMIEPIEEVEAFDQDCCDCCDKWYSIDFLARGYYYNDQRIEWSGVEETFGVEGQIHTMMQREYAFWDWGIEGDFYLNQRLDRNVLHDTAERRSYMENWQMDILEISNLLISARNENWYVAIGKFESPFGRYYFPLRTNPRFDAPFIRTEAIQWRETGLLVRHERGLFVGELAFTNGNEDRETNSSKALVSRVGLEAENWAVGASVKVQDGIGSENQKQYNNHVGLDAMVRRGCWRLSGEGIYDEYGFLKPGFDPLNITWQRSLYGRDLNHRRNVPITGIGYYVDLAYEGSTWYFGLNYGEFYPQQYFGDPIHDRVTRRGMFKTLYNITPGLQAYCVVMLENENFIAQDNRPRNGKVVLAGFQGSF